MNKKPLSYEELVNCLENDDSDLDCLSEDDDGWEIEGFQQGLLKIVLFILLPNHRIFILDKVDEPDFTVPMDIQDEVQHNKVADNLIQEQDDVEMGEPDQENNANVQPVLIGSERVLTKTSKTARINSYYIINELTQKKDIIWRKNVQYLTPNIKWFQPTTVQPVDLESPLYFFRQYFTDELFHLMVENTNLYAVQEHAKFTPTSQAELETFTALHILMGNLNYPRVRCYWENKLRIPMVADAMPRDRFFKLRKHLHFVNVQEKPPECRDRLWKVRPLYDILRRRMMNLTLEPALCVDEQMVPFKGKLNIKQFVKGKPCPWGIKIFALCGTSGIMYDFIIYQGSTTELNPDQQEVLGLGASVVLKLCERIGEKNIQLYYDNFFSNYNLLQYLRQKNIYVAGTARVERFKNPPFSSDADMKKQGRGTAEELVSGDGEVILTKWFDNKAVIMASNYMSVGLTDQCKRWDKQSKEYINVSRPEVVRNYNINMGGVDKMDFLITIYRTFIRSRKWTLRMFTHAIDIACTNGWLEYKSKAVALGVRKKDIMDLLHFRAYIAEALIGSNKNLTTRQRGRPSNSSPSLPTSSRNTRPEIHPVAEVRLDGYNHLPAVDDKSFASRCKFPECKSRTHIMCQKCDVHLCITKKQNCFMLYHKK